MISQKSVLLSSLLLIGLLLIGGAFLSRNDVAVNLVKVELSAQLPANLAISNMSSAMQQIGFACSQGQGKFLSEDGRELSVPHFFWCVRESTYLLVCNRRTTVILVPSEKWIAQKHVHVDLICL
jgi:hypothetical protein